MTKNSLLVLKKESEKNWKTLKGWTGRCPKEFLNFVTSLKNNL
jgi:hypothetical protein